MRSDSEKDSSSSSQGNTLRFSETKELTLAINTDKFVDHPPRPLSESEIQADVFPSWDSGKQPPTTGLTGILLRGRKVKPRDWDASAREVQRRIANGKMPLRDQFEYHDGATATYFFRTQHDTEGVLQLLELTDDQSGIRIRYKTLKGAPSSRDRVGGAEADDPATNPSDSNPGEVDSPTSNLLEPRNASSVKVLTATQAVKQGMDYLNKRQKITVRCQVDAVKRRQFTDEYGKDHDHLGVLQLLSRTDAEPFTIRVRYKTLKADEPEMIAPNQ